jgi:hypothetical protein
MRNFKAALIALVFSPCWLLAQTVTLSGSVTGLQDAPVEGASVKFYRITLDAPSGAVRYRVVPFGQVETDGEGRFGFTADEPEQTEYAFYTCIASKEGLSLGWKSMMEQGQTMNIKLTEPQKLIGFVAQPNGTAAPDAEVSLIFVAAKGGDSSDVSLGLDPISELQTKTCSDGRFEFSRLPEGATAEFLVRKEGMAPLITFSGSINPESGLTYAVGQPDIVLTLQKPCTISGIVMTKTDQSPVEGISVMAVQDEIPMTLFNIEPAVSGADGSFTISGIAPGRYSLNVIDCPDWITEPVPLEVKGTVGARIELQKGGTLEVRIVDGDTDQPVEGANVVMMKTGTRTGQGIQTDASGTAKKQLFAGNYEVSAYKQGYRSSRNAAVAVVEDDKTAAIEIRLGGQSKLTGLVKTPDGKPAEGVRVRVMPDQGPRQNVLSDKDGRFTLNWDPEEMGWAEGEFLLLAFDEKNQLAKALSIDADAKDLDITLEKGCTVKGKVINEKGEPLSNARASLTVWTGNRGYGSNEEVKTDGAGEYVFTGLPRDQQFSVNIRNVEGYGSGSSGRFDTQTDLSEPVVLEQIVLRVADQTLSGFAVDVEGNGLEGVDLHISGNGQPSTTTKSGKDGSFKFENVCSGQAYLNAHYRQGNEYVYGNLRTEGGASDVRIILTGQGSYSRTVPKTPAPLAGKPLPSLTDYGLNLPDDARPVLVFVWDMQQRPSRHFVKELAAQKELLESKGVIVVLLNAAKVEKETLDAWLAENRVAYPSGIIGIDPDNTPFGLGVQSMPWMILTDAEHTVTAEGFAMDELADKLDAI